jgi:hypothetical protein
MPPFALRRLQHHHVAIRVVQRRLSLGLQPNRRRGCITPPFSPVHGTHQSAPAWGGAKRQRAAVSHPRSTYTFLTYTIYTLNAPLYIARSILTFNDFMWQVRPALSASSICYSRYDLAISPNRNCVAGDCTTCIRLLATETLIHVMLIVAIKDSHAWNGMTPTQLSVIDFWNLIFVWAKVCP